MTKSPYFNKVNHTQCIKLKRSHWVPPRSPFNLIQETLYHDPWKLLLCTILLQKCSGKVAIPVFWKLIQEWPCPSALLDAETDKISNIFISLGLHNTRAIRVKKFTDEFFNKKWKYPIELHGIGKYGNDSYRIFCVNEWMHVIPSDKKLQQYVVWLQNQKVNENIY